MAWRKMARAGMAAALLATMATPGGAQLLGGGGPVGGLGGLGALPGGVLGNGASDGGGAAAIVRGGLDMADGTIGSLAPADLRAARLARLRALERRYGAELEADADGQPVRRGEVLSTNPSPAALDKARAAGFTVIRREAIATLGIDIVVLSPPRRLSARKALDRLRGLDPDGDYALNHVYEPAGATRHGQATSPAARGGGGGVPIGLIDGGVGGHPAFAGAAIEQRGFAGPVRPSGHGTAVASLIVGRAGAFSGAAPGTRLLVADVYGGSPANGSAEAIARALGWLADAGARVVNISLVGPPNPLLAAAVRASEARGMTLVAAVGNDGPAAPPAYPASYPGVIAVTGVDARGRALLEAGRASHLDFAAPGADMAGAAPGGGWEPLRGTSFAAPLVTARLAVLAVGHGDDALAALAAEARPGRNVGRGIVCGACATPPAELGLARK